jgi:hypothetical protein
MIRLLPMTFTLALSVGVDNRWGGHRNSTLYQFTHSAVDRSEREIPLRTLREPGDQNVSGCAGRGAKPYSRPVVAL